MTRFPFLPRPRWRGFSFALHPDTVQGFYFARMQYSPIQAFTALFVQSIQILYRPRHKTAHGALQRLFLRLRPLNSPRYQTDTTSHRTTRDALSRYQIPPSRRDALQVSAAAYYNKVYKRADHASSGRTAPTVCGSLASADTLSAVQTRRAC